jgi:hypothetical protein
MNTEEANGTRSRKRPRYPDDEPSPGPSQAQPVCYSDSEDDEAPHWDRVYNYTKLENLRAKDGSLINNIISEESNRKTASLAKELTIEINLEDANERAEKVAIFDKIIWGKMLADEAKSISDTIDGSLRYFVTVLCALLRKKTNNMLCKFVFTNQPEYRNNTYLVEKASDLSCHVILTQQSHAEDALLQFLQERSNIYFRQPVAMGCHRPPCNSCKLMLGPPFFDNKLVIRLPSDNSDPTSPQQKHFYTPPALRSVLENHGVMERQGQGRGIVSVHGKMYYYPEMNSRWRLDYTYSKQLSLEEFNIRRQKPLVIEMFRRGKSLTFIWNETNLYFSTICAQLSSAESDGDIVTAIEFALKVLNPATDEGPICELLTMKWQPYGLSWNDETWTRGSFYSVDGQLRTLQSQPSIYFLSDNVIEKVVTIIEDRRSGFTGGPHPFGQKDPPPLHFRKLSY